MIQKIKDLEEIILIKRTCCFLRGSQHPHGSSPPLMIPVPKNPNCPLLISMGTKHVCGAHIRRQGQVHMHKIKSTFKIIKKLKWYVFLWTLTPPPFFFQLCSVAMRSDMDTMHRLTIRGSTYQAWLTLLLSTQSTDCGEARSPQHTTIPRV